MKDRTYPRFNLLDLLEGIVAGVDLHLIPLTYDQAVFELRNRNRILKEILEIPRTNEWMMRNDKKSSEAEEEEEEEEREKLLDKIVILQ